MTKKFRAQFPLVILRLEKSMIAKMISSTKSIARFKIFPETGQSEWHMGVHAVRASPVVQKATVHIHSKRIL